MQQTTEPKAMQDKIAPTHSGVKQRLAGRLQELETRYSDPLPEPEKEVDALSDTVDEHLKTMGVA